MPSVQYKIASMRSAYFRISIGLGILKDMFHIVAVNLYGDTLAKETISMSYENNDIYYSALANNVNQFLAFSLNVTRYRITTNTTDKISATGCAQRRPFIPIIDCKIKITGI